MTPAAVVPSPTDRPQRRIPSRTPLRTPLRTPAGDATAAAADAPVRCVVRDSLGPWAQAWDDLVERSALASPFLRTWWLDTAGERPYYVLVLDGDRLLGGLALDRTRVAGVDVLRVLTGGKLCPDHLDLVSDPDRVGDVVRALRGWFRSPGARVVDLDGLVAGAAVLEVLAPARVTVTDVAIWEPLTTYSDYLARRGRTFVKNLGRRERRAERRGLLFRRAEPAETSALLDHFTALHRPRPDRRELLREMPRLGPAVEAGAARGDVVLHVAETPEGHCCGVLITFVTAGRMRSYQHARSLDRDHRDVGTLLHAVAIEEACEAGMVEWDFLRGAEAYKRDFASEERPLLRARSAHGVRGRALLRAQYAAGSLRRVAGRVRRRLSGAGTSEGRGE